MLLAPSRECLYPNLRAHGYRVTSQETLHRKVRYNCVAWAALGDTKKWWQAGNEPDFFWLKGVLDDGSFQSYIELFEWLGYKPCRSRKLEMFYEKIALYAFSDGSFSHVSYQLFFGWTSKLGDHEDIRHKTLAAMEGGDYGDVKLLMKRRSGVRGFLARAFFVLTSKLWPIHREDVANAIKK
jgi:hypothetical protein